jgi:DNA-directed RNA polymerase
MEWSDLSSAQRTKLWVENDELEMAALDQGAMRYREQCNQQPMAQWSSSRRLIYACLGNMVDGIEQARCQAEQGKGLKGCQGWGIPFIVMDPGVLAVATICAAINAVQGGERAVPSVISAIANHVQAEWHYKLLQEEFPKMLAYMKRRLKRGWTARSLRTARMRMGEMGENWSLKQRRQVGAKLLDMLCERTGLMDKRVTYNKKRTTVTLRLSDEALRSIAEADTDIEILKPLLTPMVARPNKWAPGEQGGYRLLSRYHVVTKQQIGGPPPPDDHDEPVYAALNAIQETSWQVNEPVLDTMLALWHEGGGVAGVPPANDMPHYRETEMYPEDGTKDQIREWKQKAERVHTDNARMVGRRLNFLQTVAIAHRYRGKTFYFPHNCDFRGRFYPLPSFLQPQGNDVARGLLTFGKKKKLGESGLAWLWIHLANCFGIDKVSYADRIKWVLQKRPSWSRMAKNPLKNSEWMLADKPWQALACIMEIEAAMNHPEGAKEYESSLPVSVDGSNSGLQHYSAMLRDPHGAKLVNLGPSDKPEDIYSKVANWVDLELEHTCESGAIPETLSGWRGKINRKLCKRGTMTYVYGVTKQGLNDSLIEDGLCDWAEDRFSASRQIGKLIWKGILANITGAAEAMGWLKKLAKRANKRNVLLEWRSPSGFHVVHPYGSIRNERVVCMSSEVGFMTYNPDGVIRKYKQINGIAPNFVHSMDAAHMTMTVHAGIALGITHWMVIHDAFGTHACDMDALVCILKEEFVKLYSIDVLDNMRRQAEEQCQCLMPLPPEQGTFDLETVYDSDYIFSSR